MRIVGTVENITDRKRLEQALRDSEELFRRAFNDAPIGISLVSPSGRYLRVNKCCCDLLGYSQAEMLQMHFKRHYPPGGYGGRPVRFRANEPGRNANLSNGKNDTSLKTAPSFQSG